ncbi:MAG TPA: hypothetical protein VIE13_13805 [Terriglobales bacterium]
MPASSPYSPQVLSWLARLGATLPFAQAAALLAELTGLLVSAATLRRHTEALGAAAVAQEEDLVARLERDLPAPPAGPDRLVFGADGALVPLVGGEWAEVKLMSLGEPVAVAPPGTAAPTVRPTALSYFARLMDAETFGRQVLGEMRRRGVETARAVASVQDGALWLQGVVDLHRPDATRILDFAHAVMHLTALTEALFGVQTPRARQAAARLRGWLWSQGPDRVLAVLAAWARARADCPAVEREVAYFTQRRLHLDYPAFRAAGWPVGSGATESGHKQIMQARMKRAGMRRARAQVNPLLALSLLERNHRWPTDGPLLLHAHRVRSTHRRRARQHARRLVRPLPLTAPSTTLPAPRTATSCLPSRPPAPPAPHPWRRYGAPLSVKT